MQTAEVPPSRSTTELPLHILFVVNDIDFFFSHRKHYADAAMERGYRVTVATPTNQDVSDAVPNRVRQASFEFAPITLDKWGSNPLHELTAVFDLYRLYRKLAPDLVHHSTAKPVIYGGVAARLAGVPAVVNIISGMGYVFTARGLGAWLRRSVLKFLYRYGFGHPNSRLIVQNNDDLQDFVERGLIVHHKLRLVSGSGVDLAHFKSSPPPDNHTPLIVMPSRVVWHKGAGEFVSAAQELTRRGVCARFIIAGGFVPGNPAGVSLSQIESWKENTPVEFLEHHPDMPQLFRSCDIVCLPSHREGLPRALIEAAACARPIVTTDCTGCRELVTTAKNGFVVPVGDSQALADALQNLIQDRALRIEMGKESRKMIERGRYQTVQVIEDTFRIFDEVLGSEESIQSQLPFLR